MIPVLSALVGTEQGVIPVGENGHDELQALADGMKGQSVAHMTRSSSAWYAALEEGAILRSSPDGMSEQIGSLSEGTLLARCLAPHPMGLLIGTSDAHLLQWRDGRLVGELGVHRGYVAPYRGLGVRNNGYILLGRNRYRDGHHRGP